MVGGVGGRERRGILSRRERKKRNQWRLNRNVNVQRAFCGSMGWIVSSRYCAIQCATPRPSYPSCISSPIPKGAAQLDIRVSERWNMPSFRHKLPIAMVSGPSARRDTSPPRMQKPKSFRAHQNEEAESALNSIRPTPTLRKLRLNGTGPGREKGLIRHRPASPQCGRRRILSSRGKQKNHRRLVGKDFEIFMATRLSPVAHAW